jgi:hypothetical protein
VLNCQAYRACAAMARRAIQAACTEQGTPKEKLREQLDELASKGVITNNLKDCSHAAR